MRRLFLFLPLSLLAACEPCPTRDPDCLKQNDERLAQENMWRNEQEQYRHNREVRDKMVRSMIGRP